MWDSVSDGGAVTIIDTVGTLELSDTGRRCTSVPEDGEVVRVRCTKCGDEQVLGKNLAAAVWRTMRASGGWHVGCAPPERRAEHDRVVREIEAGSPRPPPGACPICERLDCGGAAA
jgi:hypothetical protein